MLTHRHCFMVRVDYVITVAITPAKRTIESTRNYMGYNNAIW